MERAIATTEALDFEDFSACVQQEFTLAGKTLTLAAATADTADARPSQFSLLFEAPAQQALGQGTYVLAHPRLGEFALFLVPVGPETGKPDTLCYESLFNRAAADAGAHSISQ